MQIIIETANLSQLDYRILALLGGIATSPADEVDEVVEPKTKPAPAKKAAAKKTAAKKAEPEPDPEPDPAAEEPLEEEEEPEVDELEEVDEDVSDEDLLKLAVKKATEMVGGGEAAKVREALDAAGASRVRELNKDNVREFFKALS